MTTSDLPRTILVLDLETLGGDEHKDAIIEVAALFCSFSVDRFMPFQEFRATIGTAPDDWEDVDPEVYQMHTDNGLREESLRSTDHLSKVDGQLSAYIRELRLPGDQVALAGSGVAHFDRRFIRVQMPALDTYLPYWALDVGVMRRLGQYVGIHSEETGDAYVKMHRALSDAKAHLDELNRWTRAVYTMTRFRDILHPPKETTAC